MMTHVVACMWIIMANMDSDKDNSWKVGYSDATKSNIYLTAVYFTVTTITTVGYGDMSAETFAEKIIYTYHDFRCLRLLSGDRCSHQLYLAAGCTRREHSS